MGAPAILGIDPGLTGALALYDAAADTLAVYDMPIINLAKGKTRRMGVDEYGFARLIDALLKEQAFDVLIERVGPRPQEGAVGAFSFGRQYGTLRGVCAAHFLRMDVVEPSVWKRRLAVPADKDAARQRASELLPRHSGFWPLKRDHGRAEAALIALYGSKQERQ